ncbi:hypothetical protein RHGRI_011195 [Rhododendron griersonianum]|uniref:Uncharacterized protein n=1 Tax=Rhododendron griersonianum TaxID=479676 RepID=A0AAV6KL08_9ERIC|nr:hypothetical protein RHGRI_011195 [Rhododendron griersonianum]
MFGLHSFISIPGFILLGGCCSVCCLSAIVSSGVIVVFGCSCLLLLLLIFWIGWLIFADGFWLFFVFQLTWHPHNTHQ